MADTSPTRTPSQPGDDVSVNPRDAGDLTVLNAVRGYMKESEDARRYRIQLNKENRRAFLGQQDWSHKVEGQSKEFLPKTPVAVEQFSAFVKRALTQFGNWFEVELGRNSQSPLTSGQIRDLIMSFLRDVYVADNVRKNIAIQLTDTVKTGALESLMILKVHGQLQDERILTVEPGQAVTDDEGNLQPGAEQLVSAENKRWYLRIDLIKNEDYYPDPSGQGLFEIHRSERDLYYLKERAEEGIYDKAAVAMIEEDFKRQHEEARRASEMAQSESKPPAFRKKVVIDEFWGSIVDSEGNMAHRNVFCAIANDKFIIRKPQANPFWHQESPFIAVPLIRVPFSTWHKALYDHAAQLNFAINEMFNLMLDGGISSVWGIKQVRTDDLEDPSQVSGGIPQGVTLQVKNTLPHGGKVVETVAQGEVPSDSMAVLEMLNREFTAAALSNELKMGSLPPKQVKATEVIELTQSQAVTLDSISADIEQELITKLIRKSWLTILQNMDDAASDRIISAVGVAGAFAIAEMSPAQRFATCANAATFKVFGLSAVLGRVRDFQKLMALLQSVVQNPILLQAFFKRYSPDRVLSHLMKTLNINPEQMERDEEEQQRVDADLQELARFQEFTTGAAGGGGQAGQGGAGLSAQDVGEPQLPAEINQATNPLTGLGGSNA
jgi:hypothetical protein